MRFGVTIREDLSRFLMDYENEAAQQAWGAVNRVGERVKEDLRRRTAAALGRSRTATDTQNLVKAIRQRTYPLSRSSLGAQAFVYIPWRLAEVHFGDAETVVVPKHGRFLAIPTEAAERVGFGAQGERRTSSGFAAGNQARRSQVNAAILRFRGRWRIFPGQRGEFVLAVQPEKGGQWVVLFVLIPRARIRPRVPIRSLEATYLGWLQQELGNTFRMSGQ